MIKTKAHLILPLILIFMACEGIFDNDKLYACLDENACNYAPSDANTHDSELCEFPDEFFDCEGNCLVDEDACGICGGDGVDTDDDGICDDIDLCIGSHKNGFSCIDIHVLYDFIDSNPALDTLGVEISYEENEYNFYNPETFEVIGELVWEGDPKRLVYLSLSDEVTADLVNLIKLTNVPSTIGQLDSLEKLYLNGNNLSFLPIEICDIPAVCDIYVQNNNLCEEYNYSCIDYFQPDSQNCDD